MHNCQILHFLDTLGCLLQAHSCTEEIIPRLTTYATKCPQNHRQHIWQWSFTLTSKWSRGVFRWLSIKKQDELLTHTCRGTYENNPRIVLSVLSCEATRLGRAGCGVQWGLQAEHPEQYFCLTAGSWPQEQICHGADEEGAEQARGTAATCAAHHPATPEQGNSTALCKHHSCPCQKRQGLISELLTRGKSSMRNGNGKRTLEKTSGAWMTQARRKAQHWLRSTP